MWVRKAKVIIVRDFRQLAPITHLKTEDSEDYPILDIDIFNKTGISEKINKGMEEERLTTLQEQRRMPKEIAELVNELVYGGTLKTEKKPIEKDKKEKEVIASKPFSGEKIILCDTSTLNPWCRKSKSGSHVNVFNAFLSVLLAEKSQTKQSRYRSHFNSFHYPSLPD